MILGLIKIPPRGYFFSDLLSLTLTTEFSLTTKKKELNMIIQIYPCRGHLANENDEIR